MKSLTLFCDGSVNPQSKIGFGAYFIYDETLATQNIKLKKFEDTSSTKLELEVLLWALDDEIFLNNEIMVYTDCQNILGLENRREKLEKNSYKSSTGKDIKNTELYKAFFQICDRLNCKFIKIKGHKPSQEKDDTDRLFNLVDKASRKALREYLS
ncbi:MAG: RNase H family protein [Arcobacter sp.]|uniref:RNase H family protein n=1 Tax=Arcobacter sp. TaxID=1872629 RepID=UPI003B009A99